MSEIENGRLGLHDTEHSKCNQRTECTFGRQVHQFEVETSGSKCEGIRDLMTAYRQSLDHCRK